MVVKPMLGDNKPWNEDIIQMHLKEAGFLWMQPKIDGMRVIVNECAEPRSRSGKLHKHKALQKYLMAVPSLIGFDGEVVTGHEYSEDSFRQSMSGIRAEDGAKEFTFYLFDNYQQFGNYGVRYDRILEVSERLGEFAESDEYHARLVACPTWRVTSLDDIYSHEELLLADKWEGGMLRHPGRAYKHGRSTTLGGELLKLKRYTEDAEAIVIGWEAWETNENEATTSELGYTARSSHQENKKPLERLGAWKVELLTDRSVKFKVGVLKGVTHDDRDQLWKDKEHYLGRIMCFKHQGYGGGYSAPRTPVFLNWRPASEF